MGLSGLHAVLCPSRMRVALPRASFCNLTTDLFRQASAAMAAYSAWSRRDSARRDLRRCSCGRTALQNSLNLASDSLVVVITSLGELGGAAGLPAFAVLIKSVFRRVEARWTADGRADGSGVGNGEGSGILAALPRNS